MTGVGRHALLSMLEDIGSRAPLAWQEPLGLLRTDDHMVRNDGTLKILMRSFDLKVLSALQGARYLELVEPKMFCATSSGGLGPNALQFLKLLFPDETAKLQESPTWQRHLRRLSTKLPETLPLIANKLLGKAATDWALKQKLPGITTYGHLQVLEHMLCEAVKVTQYEKRTSKKGGPLLRQTQQSTKSCSPEHACSMNNPVEFPFVTWPRMKTAVIVEN